MKDCFSYIRFSSVGQKNGTSLERQSAIAPQVATEKGWNLRTDLNASDLGVSAFKGDNMKTLDAIVQSAKNGKIPQGSVMIIEAFDRFSRLDVDIAEDKLKELLRAGIEVYVYRGGHHLTKESLKKPIDRIIALLELAAANEYSAKLSERLKAAHKSKREKIQNQIPLATTKSGLNRRDFASWISCQNGRFELNGKAKIVAGIFEKYLSGKGPGLIARELNQGNIPTLSGKSKSKIVNGVTVKPKSIWTQGVIYKLLQNRQTIGEYSVNGDTVKNYLPAAVSEETFLKVQSRLNDNRGKRPVANTDSENLYNIFQGLSYCPNCGTKIKVVKQGKYMTCYGTINGVCEQRMITYTPLEKSFHTQLMFHIEELISDDSGNTVNSHLQILRGQLSEIQKEITKFETAIEDSVINNRLTALPVLDKKLAALKSEETETKKKLEIESARTVAVKGSDEKYKQLVLSIKTGLTDKEIRVKVNSWLRENVNRVDVNRNDRTYSMDFRNGGFIKVNFERNELLEIRKPSTVVSFKGEREYIAADVKTA